MLDRDTTIQYVQTSDLFQDVRCIITESQRYAYQAVNVALVQRNWLLGKRIVEEILNGEDRAEYGNAIIQNLAKDLTTEFGKGFTKTNLYQFVNFYKTFPDIFHAVSGKFTDLLSWTHYRILLQEFDNDARAWYAREAAKQTWSVRTLQRNISSQYYHRMLSSQRKDLVEAEMKEKTNGLQDKLEFIKNPVIAEFLGLEGQCDYTESELETSIIINLQKFIMELGKGFAFICLKIQDLSAYGRRAAC